MAVFLGILTLSYFYLLLPDTEIYQQQQLLNQEYQRFVEDGYLPSVTSILPGMPMANNLAQVLEWIACGLGEGILFSLTFATVVCGIVVLAGFIYVPILICCIVSALTCSFVYNFVLFFHDWMWTLSAK
ncbi:hypothetical protein CPB97_010103 [Podila verticillata]|nr:hypothetical protein CPB97_010103 [Podila verticillata]